MKQITKEQVIDLMNKINVDGVDNTQWTINAFVAPVKPEKWYGANDTGCDKLQPGAYCALWVDDTECSNMPTVGKWIDEKLSDDNICLLDIDGGWIVLVCLDLLEA